MRGLLALTVVVALSISGCLRDEGGLTGGNEIGGSEPVPPYHVDETFELFPSGMDETWSWEMSRGMTGQVTIEYIPDPAAASSASVCYDLSWPQGRQYRCASSNVVVGGGGSTTEKQTVYNTALLPNSFDLRVWTGDATPDPADVRVYIETFAANKD